MNRKVVYVAMLIVLVVSLVGCAAPAALVAPATLATQTVTPLIPGAKPEAIQTAQRAKRTHQGDLFQIHGVVGTGLSRSATDPTQPVIHIYVERDTPALRRLLPHDLDGVPVAVLFTLISPTVRMHLHLLSSLAFILHNEQFRSALTRQAGPDEILVLARRAEAGLKRPATVS